MEKKENTYILGKAAEYNGKTISEISTDIFTLDGKDLINAESELLSKGNLVFVPTLSTEYMLILAAKINKIGTDFFMSLPAREASAIKNKIRTALNDHNVTSTKDGKIKLTKGITCDGKKTDEILLDSDALTGQSLIDAESDMLSLGIPLISPEASTSYSLLVACQMCKASYDDIVSLPLPDAYAVRMAVKSLF